MMPYHTDITEEQYHLVSDIFDVGRYGTARKHSVRSLINAVFYLNKTGCHWRLLPNDFPPYQTVYTFYQRALRRGQWEQMRQRLVEFDRIHSGRSPNPTYGLIDSQSVKTTHASEDRGYDGGKKGKRP
jgi:putative transposase